MHGITLQKGKSEPIEIQNPKSEENSSELQIVDPSSIPPALSENTISSRDQIPENEEQRTTEMPPPPPVQLMQP
jgi:hypothetical protein